MAPCRLSRASKDATGPPLPLLSTLAASQHPFRQKGEESPSLISAEITVLKEAERKETRERLQSVIETDGSSRIVHSPPPYLTAPYLPSSLSASVANQRRGAKSRYCVQTPKHSAKSLILPWGITCSKDRFISLKGTGGSRWGETYIYRGSNSNGKGKGEEEVVVRTGWLNTWSWR